MKKEQKNTKPKSLFNSLIFWFLLMSLVPMSITSRINYQQAKQSLLSETENKLYQSSESNHKFINNWFAYRFMDINAHTRAQVNIKLFNTISEGWSSSDQTLKEYVRSKDWAKRVEGLQDDLINTNNNYDYMYDIFLIDKQGNILFSVQKEEDLGANLATGALSETKFSKIVFSTLEEGTTLFSDIERYGPSQDNLSGFLTTPLLDESGNNIGVFAVQLRLDRIFERMLNRSNDKSSQKHYLVATDGRLRSPIDNDLDSVLTQEINTEQFFRWLAGQFRGDKPDDKSKEVFEYRGPAGKKVFGIHQLVVVQNIRWVLISEIDSDEVFQTSSEMAKAGIIVLFLSIFLIIVVGLIQVRRITTPLHQLALASRNVASGKYNQQVNIETNNEIGQLANAFNNMLSKLQKNEAEINKSNEQLRSALSELSSQQYALDQHAIVAITDKAGKIVFVNDKFCEISGYSHEQLIDSNHRLLNSGYHPKSFFTEMYNTISSGLVWHGKICNRKKNGRLYWVETTITPYKDDKGEVQQYIAIRTDITKQRLFEEQQKTRLKIAAIKLAISNALTHQGSLEKQLSAGILHLFDLPNFNLKPKACLYIYNSEKQALELIAKQGSFNAQLRDSEIDLACFFEQGIHTNTLTIDTHCKEQFCSQEEAHGHYIVPLIGDMDKNIADHNNLVGVMMLYTEPSCDLDEDQMQLLEEAATIFTNAILRYQANELLKVATETAQQHSMLKGEFLASMSHEIRTPMNGVLGMLGLLLNSKLDAEQKHKAVLAKSSAESLLVLINDILDFSKVEAGKMELDIIDFNLRDMLGELSEAMALKAQDKGVEIILDLTDVEHSMVKGDPGRLRQITTNLISNAIKFTPQGEIKVSVEMHEQEGDNLLLNCHIIDSGIGIPDNKIETLFETFTQVDASTTRKYGGTGLGLAICKKLSQLMGGDIQVESELGVGSTFSFSANLKTSQQSQRVLPHVDISKLDLLIVDDNSTNLAVLRGQLEHWGATVTEANDGAHALEICRKRLVSGKKMFDVALLDMQMPEMDGAELGKTLRNESQFDSMKLVMMTSIATHNETKFFADLGFNAYFPKPATTSDLFKALSVVVDNGSALHQASPLVTHDYLASLVQINPSEKSIDFDKARVKILLVEDNKVNQMVALGILQELGFNADIAENGKQAISILNHSEEDAPYQVIYMDCQMPIMDGYQTTQNIRQGSAGELYRNIPIIAMTANAMDGDREKCLQVGMNDYISKPIDPLILENTLYLWLEEIETKTILEEKTESTSFPTKDLVCWHQESALQRLVNNKSLLLSLINTFIEEMPSKIEQLATAINHCDKVEIPLLAHNIKGAAANLSGLKLAHYCFELEKMQKSDKQHDYAPIFELLHTSYSELIEEFKHYINQEESLTAHKNAISITESITFLTLLDHRLSQSDYIEREELIPLINGNFSERANALLDELQQMITLFDLSGAQRLTEQIVTHLQEIEQGNS